MLLKKKSKCQKNMGMLIRVMNQLLLYIYKAYSSSKRPSLKTFLNLDADLLYKTS